MSWYSHMEDKFRKKLAKDCEALVFTAQKGSTLDKIWNKTHFTQPPVVVASEEQPPTSLPL